MTSTAPSPSPAPTVWLVGAGPGDPDLLTLKAARVIGMADVLLVDDLVDRRVLVHARSEARVVEVGKRGGCPSTPQAFIERLLVREALAGHCVVRLKGGDPSIFGRAGEEIEAAQAAGLRVEIVPGITAGLGAAADLGLSLTDRRCAQGVAFVTGHVQPGGGEADWTALARSGLTLVIYMGRQRAAAIARALLEAGRPGPTPAAWVVNATRPDVEHHATTLGDLAVCAGHPEDRRQGPARLTRRPDGPGILLIGDVVRAARALNENPQDAAQGTETQDTHTMSACVAA